MSSTEDWLSEIISVVGETYIDIKTGEREGDYTHNEALIEYRETDNDAKSQIRQHMLSEALGLIGEDDKEFTKRSRPYDDTDTNKLWDLANGVEPISSSQFSTWGSSANAQFRKFALKLRNTIWREAELHNNELKAELRQAFTEKYGERE